MSEGLTERERVRARFLILRGRAHLARYEGLVQGANEPEARAVAVAVAKADAGVTKKAALEEAKDDIKKAVVKAVAAWHAQRLERTTLIDSFFRGLTSRDLGACISQFQYSEKIEHRQECAQLLIAYFIWCKIVPEKKPQTLVRSICYNLAPRSKLARGPLRWGGSQIANPLILSSLAEPWGGLFGRIAPWAE